MRTIIQLIVIVTIVASVDVKVFYESRCPDSTRFIQNSLKKLIEVPNLDSLLSLTLVPYGKVQKSDTGKYDCQHGENECLGNLYEGCAFKYLQSQKEKIEFLVCFQDFNVNDFAQQLDKCGSTIKEQVKTCLQGSESQEIFKHNQELTPVNVPYVPSFQIGSEFQISRDIESNMKGWLCKDKQLLIVNGHPSTSAGHKKFLDFRFLVQKSFMEQTDVMESDIEYFVRDIQSISDFLYEIQSSYVNQSAVVAFNNFDMIFISGCGTFLPWSPQMERILVLLRMCIKVNKYCFASGSAMLSLVFISASNFDRTVQFTRNLSPNKYFIEKSTGDIYNFHPDQKAWQPRGNAGLHNTKAAQEFQTLGKYVLKAPIYRPNKLIEKISEIYTSKSNELVVYQKTSHLSHYLFHNMRQKFVASSQSKWDVHTFSFASADRAFKVLAESDRGPVIIEYGSYCIGTYFEILQQYTPTVDILKNFIKETIEKIQLGTKIEEKSSGVHVPVSKFKVKRHLNIELLYRSNPNSPKINDQMVFKHSGYAAKKLYNQFVPSSAISTHRLQQSISEQKPTVKANNESVVQITSRVQSFSMSRQEIRSRLHPSIQSRCESVWIPGSLSKKHLQNKNE